MGLGPYSRSGCSRWAAKSLLRLFGLVCTPSRASISVRRRGIVQLRRSAMGSSSKGVITRNAVSLFIGAGPGATLAVSAATPPSAESLRQRRTVSSRTPNASAICGLVQPDSVSSTARAGGDCAISAPSGRQRVEQTPHNLPARNGITA